MNDSHTENCFKIDIIPENRNNCLPFQSTCIRPWSLVGFMLLNLQFSVQYFVDHCLSFFVWPLYCLSSFDLWILITPFLYLQTYISQVWIYLLYLIKNYNITSCIGHGCYPFLTLQQLIILIMDYYVYNFSSFSTGSS